MAQTKVNKLGRKIGQSVEFGLWRHITQGLICVNGPLDGERIAVDKSKIIKVRVDDKIGMYKLKHGHWSWETR